jgi:hypothetical protein
MAASKNKNCLTAEEIIGNNGLVIENSDGTVSVYVQNVAQTALVPVILTQECCVALRPSDPYIFDANTQTCRTIPIKPCNIEDVFKIVLNPNGNDGVIFTGNQDETCNLTVDFDYMFKVKCETLFDMLVGNPPFDNTSDSFVSSTVSGQINDLNEAIDEQTQLCETISNTLTQLQIELENTQYSIVCNQPNLPPLSELPQSFNEIISNTGFGEGLPIIQENNQDYSNIDGVIYCINGNVGLSAWANILGQANFDAFINGDPNSYTCDDVAQIVTLNNNENLLVTQCLTPFGTRTFLQIQVNELIVQQEDCQNQLANLQTQLTNLQTTGLTITTSCNKPIDFFETLDVSMTLELETGNTYTTIYETFDLFPAIGTGGLYNYLSNRQNTGFYVCGGPDCEPLNLFFDQTLNNNTSTCNQVMQSLLNDLYAESGFSGLTNGVDLFSANLFETSFVSSWLQYTTTISDPNIISLINNQSIKISLKINHTCGDICILLDNIKFNKECTRIDNTSLFVTQSPGFDLERIRDNKKSWLNNTERVNRSFEIFDASGVTQIRQTNYDVDDERLVLNSKEIDLDINLALAVETDVWSYIMDNPCLLTGTTNCYPCLQSNYEFQDNIEFDFQDNIQYEFQDDTDGGTPSICCGDNLISFDNLLSQPLSAITVVEDFQTLLISELIDAKNRQTISSYATLRALYDRYINSYQYCGNYSSQFGYISMEEFANLMGNYWVDIVEQVIPSTTIWGSIEVYSNTIFDAQKFKYRAYSTLFCNNPFSGDTVLSPINGTSGQTINVECITTPINTGVTWNYPINNVSCGLAIAQMNHGSEFIGTVSVLQSSEICEPIFSQIIKTCEMYVEVQTNGLTANAVVINGTGPFTYEWSNGDVNPITTFDSEGTYAVTVVDDECCTSFTTFVISL